MMGPPITHPSAQGGGASRGLPHAPRSPAWVQLPRAGLKPDGRPAQGPLRPQKLQERHWGRVSSAAWECDLGLGQGSAASSFGGWTANPSLSLTQSFNK